MRIGIIRETKIPADSRVLLNPTQCQWIKTHYPAIEIVVQPCETRCFKDEEYLEKNIPISEDLSNCDILVGVKEQKIAHLIPNKNYFFFSHTTKEQAYNRELLKAIIQKKIQITDYEQLVNEQGERVIAFGHWAGVVGAHNGILTWGKRTNDFYLKPMIACKDYEAAAKYYKDIKLKHTKIVLTGTGRVANGAASVLNKMNIRKVSPADFLEKTFDEAVYCQLATEQMFRRAVDLGFDEQFYADPTGYVSIFEPYTKTAQIMINGIFWNNKSPKFFSKEDMKKTDFTIKVIADITCDIAPQSSIPATLRATTIAEPIFGYDVHAECETVPHQEGVVDMMTIDNLPNELPRDASTDFGNQFIENVLPELLKAESNMIQKASITNKNGTLNKPYLYLTDYISK